jgi:hypothetical protein
MIVLGCGTSKELVVVVVDDDDADADADEGDITCIVCDCFTFVLVAMRWFLTINDDFSICFHSISNGAIV